MKKALAIGLATVMAVSMSAPVFAEDEGKGIAKEDLKVGVIYIGDENEGYTAAHMKGIDEMEEKLGLDDSQIIGSSRGISGGSVLSCNRNTGCIQRTFQHA